MNGAAKTYPRHHSLNTVQVHEAVATRFPLGFVISHSTKPIRRPRSTTRALATRSPSRTGRMKLTFISTVEKSSLSKQRTTEGDAHRGIGQSGNQPAMHSPHRIVVLQSALDLDGCLRHTFLPRYDLEADQL